MPGIAFVRFFSFRADIYIIMVFLLNRANSISLLILAVALLCPTAKAQLSEQNRSLIDDISKITGKISDEVIKKSSAHMGKSLELLETQKALEEKSEILKNGCGPIDKSSSGQLTIVSVKALTIRDIAKSRIAFGSRSYPDWVYANSNSKCSSKFLLDSSSLIRQALSGPIAPNAGFDLHFKRVELFLKRRCGLDIQKQFIIAPLALYLMHKEPQKWRKTLASLGAGLSKVEQQRVAEEIARSLDSQASPDWNIDASTMRNSVHSALTKSGKVHPIFLRAQILTALTGEEWQVIANSKNSLFQLSTITKERGSIQIYQSKTMLRPASNGTFNADGELISKAPRYAFVKSDTDQAALDKRSLEKVKDQRVYTNCPGHTLCEIKSGYTLQGDEWAPSMAVVAHDLAPGETTQYSGYRFGEHRQSVETTVVHDTLPIEYSLRADMSTRSYGREDWAIMSGGTGDSIEASGTLGGEVKVSIVDTSHFKLETTSQVDLSFDGVSKVDKAKSFGWKTEEGSREVSYSQGVAASYFADGIDVQADYSIGGAQSMDQISGADLKESSKNRSGSVALNFGSLAQTNEDGELGASVLYVTSSDVVRSDGIKSHESYSMGEVVLAAPKIELKGSQTKFKGDGASEESTSAELKVESGKYSFLTFSGEKTKSTYSGEEQESKVVGIAWDYTKDNLAMGVAVAKKSEEASELNYGEMNIGLNLSSKESVKGRVALSESSTGTSGGAAQFEYIKQFSDAESLMLGVGVASVGFEAIDADQTDDWVESGSLGGVTDYSSGADDFGQSYVTAKYEKEIKGGFFSASATYDLDSDQASYGLFVSKLLCKPGMTDPRCN